MNVPFRSLLYRVLPLLVVLTMTACEQETEEADVTMTPTPAEGAATPAEVAAARTMPVLDLRTPTPQGADETEVVAVVDGEDITYAQLRQETDSLIAQRTGGQVPPAMFDQFRPQFEPQALNQIVLKMQLQDYAQEHNLIASATAVDQAMADIRSRFETQEQMDQALAMQGMTEAGLEGDVEKQELMMAAVDYFLDQQPDPPQEEIEQHYQRNLQAYKVPQQVTASHILLAFDPGEKESPEKLQQLEDIREQIAGGADFAELAREHSDDPGSAAQGGFLGAFPREQMVEPFAEAAFTTEPGQLSEIVETRFGYHLIQVHGKIEASTPTLEEARERVINDLKQEAVNDWMEGLIAEASIENVNLPSQNRPQGMRGMPGMGGMPQGMPSEAGQTEPATQ